MDLFRRPMCIKVPNFVSIASTFAEIWPIIDFSRWRPSAILDLFYMYSDHPRSAFVDLCHCAKFGWNRCSSLDDMPVLMFCKFGLKMPIHIPLWVVFGDLTPYVAWLSGRTSVFGRRTFSVLRSTCSWRVTTYVGKPSAMGQPTRPTQPFIPSGSIDE